MIRRDKTINYVDMMKCPWCKGCTGRPQIVYTLGYICAFCGTTLTNGLVFKVPEQSLGQRNKNADKYKTNEP